MFNTISDGPTDHRVQPGFDLVLASPFHTYSRPDRDQLGGERRRGERREEDGRRNRRREGK